MKDNENNRLILLAKLGLIALLDESTGYQYKRLNDDLKKMIDSQIKKNTEEIPDDFYKELCRLNNWEYSNQTLVANGQQLTEWSTKFVYEQLVYEDYHLIKNRARKDTKLSEVISEYQSIIIKAGHPKLSAQIDMVVSLMEASNNMDDFLVKFGNVDAKLNVGKEEKTNLSTFDKNIMKALKFKG